MVTVSLRPKWGGIHADSLCFLKAIRFFSPTGWLLLFFPGLWGYVYMCSFSSIWAIFIVALGAFWARSLGCLCNDWVDRDVDLLVRRTSTRPLIGYKPSFFFVLLAALSCVGPAVFFLLILPIKAIGIGVLGAIGALVYPFCKRWTMYPQVFLGVIFNLAVFMPAAIEKIPFSLDVWILYLCGISWTLVYDTVYAYQDYQDDLRCGIGSLAVRLGLAKGKIWLACFCFFRYAMLAFLTCSLKAHMILLLMALWEVLCLKKMHLEDPKACAKAFQRARWQGVFITIWLAGVRFLA